MEGSGKRCRGCRGRERGAGKGRNFGWGYSCLVLSRRWNGRQSSYGRMKIGVSQH